ncbi:MAG: response regulator [Bacteroidota bacterium]
MNKLRKILLVDDDEHTNFLNKAIITHARFAEEVIAQMTAEEALAYIRDHQASGDLPDLIFLDINMPLMDGWEFMQEYAQMFLDDNTPKVIMLTSSINPKDEQRAQKLEGLSGFRSKPLSSEVLEEIYHEHFTAAV